MNGYTFFTLIVGYNGLGSRWVAFFNYDYGLNVTLRSMTMGFCKASSERAEVLMMSLDFFVKGSYWTVQAAGHCV